MAEPIPQSQSPKSVVDQSIRYVRKDVPTSEAKWNLLKRDRSEDDPEDKWYNVDIECFEGTRKTLVLQTSNKQVDPTKPMTTMEYHACIKQMRSDRLSRFFETAQFRDTPIQYMPALDKLEIIWAKEDEQIEMIDAALKEAESKNN